MSIVASDYNPAYSETWKFMVPIDIEQTLLRGMSRLLRGHVQCGLCVQIEPAAGFAQIVSHGPMRTVTLAVIATVAQLTLSMPGQAAPLSPSRYVDACKFVVSNDHNAHFWFTAAEPRPSTAPKSGEAYLYVTDSFRSTWTIDCQFAVLSGDRLELTKLEYRPSGCFDAHCVFGPFAPENLDELNQRLLRRRWH